MEPENDESRLSAAPVDGRDEDHPDSARQHEPRSRGRNGQHRSVDLSRSIGGDTQAAPTPAGRFEWERAFREAGIESFPGGGIDLDRVKAYGLLLASFANRQGEDVFPSQATLASYVGSNERNARKYLRALEEGGWIVGERRGRQRTTRYRLVVPDRRSRAGRDGAVESGFAHEDRRGDAGKTGAGTPPTRTATRTGKTPTASCHEHTNGDDDMNYDLPAIEDDALHDALRGLSPAPRELAAAKWKIPGGPEIVRASLDRADRGDSIDEARFENLLADERVAFLVESTDGFVRRAEIHAYWGDAERSAERLRSDGLDVVVTAAVGHDAEAHLRGAA